MSAFTQAAWHGFPLPLRELRRYGSSGNCWSLASSLHSLFCLLNLLVTTKAKSTSPTLRDWFCFPGVTTSEPAHHYTGVHVCAFPSAPAASQRWQVRLRLPTGTACGTRHGEATCDSGPSKHNQANLEFKYVTHRISALTIGSLMPPSVLLLAAPVPLTLLSFLSFLCP